MTEPAVSVIIPCFNRPAELRLTLAALARQTLPPGRFEVIVVDDGSTDPPMDIVHEAEALHGYALRLEKQDNRGPGAARNLGAAFALAPLLVFLDADIIPAPDLLQRYLVAFKGHPGSLLLGRQLPWPQAFTTRFEQVFNYVAASDPGPVPRELPFYYMASGNFAAGATVFEALGGFDEHLRMTEDTELAYRAHLQGVELRYEPLAAGYHNHSKTMKQLCQNSRASAWWTAQSMDKHPSLRGQLPVFRELEPIRLGGDGTVLVARKLLRRLIAALPCLAALKAFVRALELAGAPPDLLTFLYWKLLASYRLIGLRDGLKHVRSHHQPPDPGLSRTRPEMAR